MNKMQKEIDGWVKQYGGYWNPHEILARLSEEVGELAREINHRWGPKQKKETEDTKEIADEIADIFFTLGCLANSLNIDIDKSFSRMMDKLHERDSDRFEKK